MCLLRVGAGLDGIAVRIGLAFLGVLIIVLSSSRFDLDARRAVFAFLPFLPLEFLNFDLRFDFIGIYSKSGLTEVGL